jgi:c-di-GMP-binding flagellar brake protein YcgR
MKQSLIKALSILHPLFKKIDMVKEAKSDGRNRRTSERVVLETEVKVRMKGQEICAAESKNISLGGMCLIFDRKVPDASTGTLWISRLYADDYVKFEASFRKVWTKPENPGSERTMMGIVFQDLVPGQRDKLHAFLKTEKQSAPAQKK